MLDYKQFLKSKHAVAAHTGFNPTRDINPLLYPFQQDVVRWALNLGKAAIFAAVGLGKTAMQTTWAFHVMHHTQAPVLILAPLAVGAQTVREGAKFGIPVTQIRSMKGVTGAGVYVCNYEMLDALDTDAFVGVVLDESSILKSFTGTTKRALIERFTNTRYKLACTATPAPNDYMELGNHAEFLDVMPSNEMLMRWFINDTMSAGDYRLKDHARADFYRWITSWAVAFAKPSDLGDEYHIAGYDLPPLTIVPHYIEAPQESIERAWAEGRLMPDTAPSSTQLGKVKRESLQERVQKVKEIVAQYPDDEPFVIWCHLNDESAALAAAIPDAVEGKGSDKPDAKAEKLLGFTDGKYRILITKSSIAGFGMNWQHVANPIFVGVDYSFESFYQALGRNYRYGQTRPVTAHVIYAATEGNVIQILERKRQLHEEMHGEMIQAMKQYGLFRDEARRVLRDVEGDVAHGNGWTLYLGDCVEMIQRIPDNSIDFGIHSPPFSSLYIYSDAEQDMGNSANDDEFFEHYKFLIREMYRTTAPGRLCAVHCKDLPRYMNRDGAAGLQDFPGMIIQAFEEMDKPNPLYFDDMQAYRAALADYQAQPPKWQYHSRVTIWKDPVTEMQRTKNHGLLHKNFEKEANACRQGMPDYLLVFRKYGLEGQVPVTQHRIAGDYIGTQPPADPMENDRQDRKRYSIEVWQRYASPVWFDINQTNVLNTQIAKESQDEKHICVARDSLVLTSNGYVPIQDVEIGDMVLTHRGRWQPVTAKRLIGMRSTIRVTAQGVPNLIVTPEHKIWTRLSRTQHPRKEAMKSDPIWLEAKDTLGSYVNLPLPPTQESELTEQEWWIVGRWLGDGHLSVRGVPHITCAFDELEELKAKLGVRAGHVGTTQTAFQIYVKGRDGRHGDHLHNMIKKCGKGAMHKVVPIEGLTLDPQKSAALLEGYLSADGHFVEMYQRDTASSISRALLLGMAIVAQRARGVVASVYHGRKGGKSTIQGREVNTNPDWVMSIPPRNLSAKILDDGGWKKVRSITDAGELEVWDIQVAEDESFVVEGCVVHNCPLQLDVIARSVDLWSNPGDTVFSPFAGIGSEGYEALKLGRKFIGIELKRGYWEIAQRNLRAAEVAASQLTLF